MLFRLKQYVNIFAIYPLEMCVSIKRVHMCIVSSCSHAVHTYQHLHVNIFAIYPLEMCVSIKRVHLCIVSSCSHAVHTYQHLHDPQFLIFSISCNGIYNIFQFCSVFIMLNSLGFPYYLVDPHPPDIRGLLPLTPTPDTIICPSAYLVMFTIRFHHIFSNYGRSAYSFCYHCVSGKQLQRQLLSATVTVTHGYTIVVSVVPVNLNRLRLS